jgi:predicted RND superfamily exporter protein
LLETGRLCTLRRARRRRGRVVLQQLAAFCVRRPRIIVAFFVVVAILAAIGTARLKEEEDLLVFLPTADRDVQLFQDVSRRFGGLRVALIGVESPADRDVFSSEIVTKIKAATDALHNVNGVDHELSMTSVPDVTAGPAGAVVDYLIKEPPADEAEHAALRQKVLSRDEVAGSLVSRDGRAALIMVFLAEGVGDRKIVGVLRKVAREKLAGLSLYFGGAPFAGEAIYDETQGDVWRLSPIVLLVLLLVVVLSFRDPVGVVLTVGSVAFSVLLVLGGMGWWGEKFTVASSTLPVILFASGSSYAVHVLGRYYLLRDHQPSAERAIREALHIVGPPLLIAAGTTAVGFYSFVATDVRPMRAFGIACGTGVLICWITSLTLVPAVVALWPRKSREHTKLDRMGDGIVAVWRWARRHRVIVAGGALVAAALTVQPMLKVQVRMEPRTFFRVGSEPWLAEKFLEDHFGGAHFVQVWVHGDLDDPATLREMARLEDYTRSLDGVSGLNSVLGPLRISSQAMGEGLKLPSTTSQAANLFLFIEGQAGISNLLAQGRRDALIQVRVRGDARPIVEKLEEFAAHGLRARPALPTSDELAERVAWFTRSVTHRDADLEQLKKTLRVIAPPGELDEEWVVARHRVVADYFSGPEAPPLSGSQHDEIVKLANDNAPNLKEALIAASKSPDEGAADWQSLTTRLDEERHRLAVDRAVPLVAAAAGLDRTDAQLTTRLALIVDDRFAMAAGEGTAREPLRARIAGEPILDRGFSRSVERNQVRSLLISIVVVLLLLLALFRSAWQAVVCFLPALLTLALIFGAMGIAHVAIDLGTSLVGGIATGAGADFAMHYMWYLRRQPADEVSRTVGPIMVVSILLVSLGFVVLALGRSPVMHLFGTLAGLSMSLSALLTCLLVPALLNKVGADIAPAAASKTPEEVDA